MDWIVCVSCGEVWDLIILTFLLIGCCIETSGVVACDVEPIACICKQMRIT